VARVSYPFLLVCIIVFGTIWPSRSDALFGQESPKPQGLSREDQEILTEVWHRAVIDRVRKADAFKYSNKQIYDEARVKYSDLVGLHEGWLETITTSLLNGNDPRKSKTLTRASKQIASAATDFDNFVDDAIRKSAPLSRPFGPDTKNKMTTAEVLKWINDTVQSWWDKTKTRKIEARKLIVDDMRKRLPWKSWDEVTSDLRTTNPTP